MNGFTLCEGFLCATESVKDCEEEISQEKALSFFSGRKKSNIWGYQHSNTQISHELKKGRNIFPHARKISIRQSIH